MHCARAGELWGVGCGTLHFLGVLCLGIYGNPAVLAFEGQGVACGARP